MRFEPTTLEKIIKREVIEDQKTQELKEIIDLKDRNC